MLIRNEQIVQQTEDILNDNTTYRLITTSKVRSIENQANRLIRSACKHTFDKSQLEKMLSCGTQPASFRATIKDHKQTTDGIFPLRPIASCVNNPTEKLDWLVSRILTQLTTFVPAHISNTDELINKLKLVDNVNSNDVFISLDVKNLYPSIPIIDGITKVINFADKHWDKIDHFSLDINTVRNMLTFICHNYEITYNNKNYLQIKGCPMGTHFSPPFAIIYMHTVETKALSNLHFECNLNPVIYARYIDDVIMGPFNRLTTDFSNILDKFNKVNNDIQFTIEIPKVNTLNFLDISITTSNNGVDYIWFQKLEHSGKSLRYDSYVPSHIKHNYMKNTVQQVKNRCSSEDNFELAMTKLKRNFDYNGFRYRNTKKQKRKQYDKETKTYFKIKFVNDKFDRQVRSLLNKYSIPANLISCPNTNLANTLKTKNNKQKHDDCNLCDKLPEKYICNDRFLIYKFICKVCGQFYIGQSCRPFKFRYAEHHRAFNSSRSNDSALVSHTHEGRQNSIDLFNLEILEKCRDPLDTRLTEARYIRNQTPKINRKHELVEF